MRETKVKVLFSANYFSKKRIDEICEKVGASPVIVPMGVDHNAGIDDVFKLVDYWVMHLKEAFLKSEQKG